MRSGYQLLDLTKYGTVSNWTNSKVTLTDDEVRQLTGDKIIIVKFIDEDNYIVTNILGRTDIIFDTINYGTIAEFSLSLENKTLQYEGLVSPYLDSNKTIANDNLASMVGVSSTKTYTLKLVNGVKTWVEETE